MQLDVRVRGKTIANLKARLGIPPSEYREMVERLCESAVEVGKELTETAHNETRWEEISKQMLHTWDEGMRTLRETLPARKRSVTRP